MLSLSDRRVLLIILCLWLLFISACTGLDFAIGGAAPVLPMAPAGSEEEDTEGEVEDEEPESPAEEPDNDEDEADASAEEPGYHNGVVPEDTPPAPIIQRNRPDATLEDLIAEGILLPFENLEDGHELVMERIPVVRRDLPVRLRLSTGGFSSPGESLFFETGGGSVHFYVGAGQYVREGELLASQTFSPDEQDELDRLRAQNNLRQFVRDFEMEETRLLIAIETARENFYAAAPADWERATIELELAELALRRFRFENEPIRVALEEALEEAERTFQPEQLFANFDGVITGVAMAAFPTYMPDGRRWALSMSIADDFWVTTFLSQWHQTTTAMRDLPVQMPMHALFRYGDVLTFDGSWSTDGVRYTLEFDAQLMSDPWIRGPGWSRGAGWTRQTMEWNDWHVFTPLDMQAVTSSLSEGGLTPNRFFQANFNTYITINLAPNSLLLPVRAIHLEGAVLHGLDEGPARYREFVHLYTGDGFVKHFVVTGVRHGGYVQIISGLEDGMEVVVFS